MPAGKIDVALDTDAYNKIDDQFAIAYLLNCEVKLHIKEIYAAPFFNNKFTSLEDGMERSYDEIVKFLTFAGREDLLPVVSVAPAPICPARPRRWNPLPLGHW